MNKSKPKLPARAAVCIALGLVSGSCMADAAIVPDACVGARYQLNIRPKDKVLMLDLDGQPIPLLSRSKTTQAYPDPGDSLAAPCLGGHLGPSDVGVVVNQDDPYSVAVGDYYVQRRGILPANVLKVSIPFKPELTPEEFATLSGQIETFFGGRVQALALVWQQPFAVAVAGDVLNGVHFNCNNSITAAVTLGYSTDISCLAAGKYPSRDLTTPYYLSASSRPYQDFKMRLSMLLAANNVDEAKALIERGIQADKSLGRATSVRAMAHFLDTSDQARGLRRYYFPPQGTDESANFKTVVDKADSLVYESRVLVYMAGTFRVENLGTVSFLPGALADHLTSYGGILYNTPDSQMNALSWIGAGATASYGSTSEPYAYLEKFPDPRALLPVYAQGATAIEAYWKSVAWPQQGLFVGEPLAAPFAR